MFAVLIIRKTETVINPRFYFWCVFKNQITRPTFSTIQSQMNSATYIV